MVRPPRTPSEDAARFEVYLGDGRTEPIDEHLASHPRASYVAVQARLRCGTGCGSCLPAVKALVRRVRPLEPAKSTA